MDSDDLVVDSPSRRLPPVRVVGIEPEPMTSVQDEAAVEVLAVLITEWEARGGDGSGVRRLTLP